MFLKSASRCSGRAGLEMACSLFGQPKWLPRRNSQWCGAIRCLAMWALLAADVAPTPEFPMVGCDQVVGCLAGRHAVLVGRLAGRQAGWLAGKQACWLLMGWIAGKLAGWQAGELTNFCSKTEFESPLSVSGFQNRCSMRARCPEVVRRETWDWEDA